MAGKVRDHPWNKLNKSARLHVEAAKDILHPDGKVHIFEYEGWRLLTNDGVFEVLSPGETSLSPLFREGQYISTLIHPIKKFRAFNFYTEEWGDFVRCHECRHLFEPHADQEIYCPDCRESVKAWHTLQNQGKRLVEKIRKWKDLGYSTDEINLRLNGVATCARCHKPFPAKRFDAKHCNRCRTAISREKKIIILPRSSSPNVPASLQDPGTHRSHG